MKPSDYVIAEGFILRHKNGMWIPTPNRARSGRGGSHVEPTNLPTRPPRIFPSELSVRSYLGQWVRGKAVCYRDGDGDEDHQIIPQPHRIKADMEIVPVSITLKDFWK